MLDCRFFICFFHYSDLDFGGRSVNLLSPENSVEGTYILLKGTYRIGVKMYGLKFLLCVYVFHFIT